MQLDPSIGREVVEVGDLHFSTLTCGGGDRLALCLHGFPELGFSWRNQLPMLAEEGYRAWAPDLRGYGASSRPPGVSSYRLEELMADVAGLIDAARPRETLLLAHDWGGVIAWYFAMRRIRPIDRLVICNLPHPAVMAKVLRTSWRQRLRSWYALFFQLPWLPEKLLTAREGRAIERAFTEMAVNPSRFPKEVTDVYREAGCRPGAMTAMINYYRALFRGGARRQTSLGHPIIDVPTLMIWGEQDRALGKETTYGTEKYVSDLTLRYIPNASHWVQQDAPDVVNSMIHAWLQGEDVHSAASDDIPEPAFGGPPA